MSHNYFRKVFSVALQIEHRIASLSTLIAGPLLIKARNINNMCVLKGSYLNKKDPTFYATSS